MSNPNNTTRNHGFQLWADGQANWEHRTDFEALDTKVEIRDVGKNRRNYDPKANALFRATDTGDVYLGTGSQWTKLNPYSVPSGHTVADIAATLRENSVVVLEPGVTYSNDGGTIEYPSNETKTVMAHGAVIEVRSNPTVLMSEASVGGGWSSWEGGLFEGSQSPGEVAFQVEDGIKNQICPRAIHDCETGIALTNDDLWCEMNRVRFFGRNNECDVMLVGGNGSPPSGSSVSRSNGGAEGSPSFRFLQLELQSSVRQSQSALDRGYGVYTDEASPYAGFLNVSVGIGDGITGFRYHGRMNGNTVWFHAESPQGQNDGGVGFQVDKNRRGPALMRTRIGGGVDTPFVNNTDEPIVHFDTSQDPSQNYWRILRDGEPHITFAKEDDQHVMRMPGVDKIRFADNTELP